MTVRDYIMSHDRCGINNITLEEAKRIAREFQSRTTYNDFPDYVQNGLANAFVHMQFRNGAFCNWRNGDEPYFVGDYGVESTIWFVFLESDDDEDEIDVSLDVLTDILRGCVHDCAGFCNIISGLRHK